MQEPRAYDLFEASCVYRLKDTGKFLAIIECLGGKEGRRYFKAFLADKLDGEWTPVAEASTWEAPFAGSANVKAADGGTLWSADISHGEILREGCDETMTVDPKNLHLLYQGLNRNVVEPNYGLLPYRLALLMAEGAQPVEKLEK